MRDPGMYGVRHSAVLDRLVDAYNLVAQTGEPFLAVLSSPSGHGKTRLVQELYSRLTGDGRRLGAVEEAATLGGTEIALERARKRVRPDTGDDAELVWLAAQCAELGSGERVTAVDQLVDQMQVLTLPKQKRTEAALNTAKIARGVIKMTPVGGVVTGAIEAVTGVAGMLGGASDVLSTAKDTYSQLQGTREARTALRDIDAYLQKRHRDEFLEQLDTVTLKRPAVLVLDDAQHADSESVEILNGVLVPDSGMRTWLSRRALTPGAYRKRPVLIVVTVWDHVLAAENDPLAGWLRDLAGLLQVPGKTPRFQAFSSPADFGPLDADDATALFLDDLEGVGLGSPAVAAATARAVRQLTEQGGVNPKTLRHHAGRLAYLHRSFPSRSPEELLEHWLTAVTPRIDIEARQRFESLGAAQDVVRAAALQGPLFDARAAVLAVTELPDLDGVRRHLDVATAQGYIEPADGELPGAYRFSPECYQVARAQADVVLPALLPDVVRGLRLALDAALEALFTPEPDTGEATAASRRLRWLTQRYDAACDLAPAGAGGNSPDDDELFTAWRTLARGADQEAVARALRFVADEQADDADLAETTLSMSDAVRHQRLLALVRLLLAEYIDADEAGGPVQLLGPAMPVFAAAPATPEARSAALQLVRSGAALARDLEHLCEQVLVTHVADSPEAAETLIRLARDDRRRRVAFDSLLHLHVDGSPGRLRQLYGLSRTDQERQLVLRRATSFADREPGVARLLVEQGDDEERETGLRHLLGEVLTPSEDGWTTDESLMVLTSDAVHALLAVDDRAAVLDRLAARAAHRYELASRLLRHGGERHRNAALRALIQLADTDDRALRLAVRVARQDEEHDLVMAALAAAAPRSPELAALVLRMAPAAAPARRAALQALRTRADDDIRAAHDFLRHSTDHAANAEVMATGQRLGRTDVDAASWLAARADRRRVIAPDPRYDDELRRFLAGMATGSAPAAIGWAALAADLTELAEAGQALSAHVNSQPAATFRTLAAHATVTLICDVLPGEDLERYRRFLRRTAEYHAMTAVHYARLAREWAWEDVDYARALLSRHAAAHPAAAQELAVLAVTDDQRAEALAHLREHLPRLGCTAPTAAAAARLGGPTLSEEEAEQIADIVLDDGGDWLDVIPSLLGLRLQPQTRRAVYEALADTAPRSPADALAADRVLRRNRGGELARRALWQFAGDHVGAARALLRDRTSVDRLRELAPGSLVISLELAARADAAERARLLAPWHRHPEAEALLLLDLEEPSADERHRLDELVRGHRHRVVPMVLRHWRNRPLPPALAGCSSWLGAVVARATIDADAAVQLAAMRDDVAVRATPDRLLRHLRDRRCLRLALTHVPGDADRRTVCEMAMARLERFDEDEIVLLAKLLTRVGTGSERHRLAAVAAQRSPHLADTVTAVFEPRRQGRGGPRPAPSGDDEWYETLTSVDGTTWPRLVSLANRIPEAAIQARRLANTPNQRKHAALLLRRHAGWHAGAALRLNATTGQDAPIRRLVAATPFAAAVGYRRAGRDRELRTFAFESLCAAARDRTAAVVLAEVVREGGASRHERDTAVELLTGHVADPEVAGHVAALLSELDVVDLADLQTAHPGAALGVLVDAMLAGPVEVATAVTVLNGPSLVAEEFWRGLVSRAPGSGRAAQLLAAVADKVSAARLAWACESLDARTVTGAAPGLVRAALRLAALHGDETRVDRLIAAAARMRDAGLDVELLLIAERGFAEQVARYRRGGTAALVRRLLTIGSTDPEFLGYLSRQSDSGAIDNRPWKALRQAAQTVAGALALAGDRYVGRLACTTLARDLAQLSERTREEAALLLLQHGNRTQQAAAAATLRGPAADGDLTAFGTLYRWAVGSGDEPTCAELERSPGLRRYLAHERKLPRPLKQRITAALHAHGQPWAAAELVRRRLVGAAEAADLLRAHVQHGAYLIEELVRHPLPVSPVLACMRADDTVYSALRPALAEVSERNIRAAVVSALLTPPGETLPPGVVRMLRQTAPYDADAAAALVRVSPAHSDRALAGETLARTRDTDATQPVQRLLGVARLVVAGQLPPLRPGEAGRLVELAGHDPEAALWLAVLHRRRRLPVDAGLGRPRVSELLHRHRGAPGIEVELFLLGTRRGVGDAAIRAAVPDRRAWTDLMHIVARRGDAATAERLVQAAWRDEDGWITRDIVALLRGDPARAEAAAQAYELLVRTARTSPDAWLAAVATAIDDVDRVAAGRVFGTLLTRRRARLVDAVRHCTWLRPAQLERLVPVGTEQCEQLIAALEEHADDDPRAALFAAHLLIGYGGQGHLGKARQLLTRHPEHPECAVALLDLDARNPGSLPSKATARACADLALRDDTALYPVLSAFARLRPARGWSNGTPLNALPPAVWAKLRERAATLGADTPPSAIGAAVRLGALDAARAAALLLPSAATDPQAAVQLVRLLPADPSWAPGTGVVREALVSMARRDPSTAVFLRRRAEVAVGYGFEPAALDELVRLHRRSDLACALNLLELGDRPWSALSEEDRAELEATARRWRAAAEALLLAADTPEACALAQEVYAPHLEFDCRGSVVSLLDRWMTRPVRVLLSLTEGDDPTEQRLIGVLIDLLRARSLSPLRHATALVWCVRLAQRHRKGLVESLRPELWRTLVELKKPPYELVAVFAELARDEMEREAAAWYLSRLLKDHAVEACRLLLRVRGGALRPGERIRAGLVLAPLAEGDPDAAVLLDRLLDGWVSGGDDAIGDEDPGTEEDEDPGTEAEADLAERALAALRRHAGSHSAAAVALLSRTAPDAGDRQVILNRAVQAARTKPALIGSLLAVLTPAEGIQVRELLVDSVEGGGWELALALQPHLTDDQLSRLTALARVAAADTPGAAQVLAAAIGDATDAEADSLLERHLDHLPVRAALAARRSPELLAGVTPEQARPLLDAVLALPFTAQRRWMVIAGAAGAREAIVNEILRRSATDLDAALLLCRVAAEDPTLTSRARASVRGWAGQDEAAACALAALPGDAGEQAEAHAALQPWVHRGSVRAVVAAAELACDDPSNWSMAEHDALLTVLRAPHLAGSPGWHRAVRAASRLAPVALEAWFGPLLERATSDDQTLLLLAELAPKWDRALEDLVCERLRSRPALAGALAGRLVPHGPQPEELNTELRRLLREQANAAQPVREDGDRDAAVAWLAWAEPTDRSAAWTTLLAHAEDDPAAVVAALHGAQSDAERVTAWSLAQRWAERDRGVAVAAANVADHRQLLVARADLAVHLRDSPSATFAALVVGVSSGRLAQLFPPSDPDHARLLDHLTAHAEADHRAADALVALARSSASERLDAAMTALFEFAPRSVEAARSLCRHAVGIGDPDQRARAMAVADSWYARGHAEFAQYKVDLGNVPQVDVDDADVEAVLEAATRHPYDRRRSAWRARLASAVDSPEAVAVAAVLSDELERVEIEAALEHHLRAPDTRPRVFDRWLAMAADPRDLVATVPAQGPAVLEFLNHVNEVTGRVRSSHRALLYGLLFAARRRGAHRGPDSGLDDAQQWVRPLAGRDVRAALILAELADDRAHRYEAAAYLSRWMMGGSVDAAVALLAQNWTEVPAEVSDAAASVLSAYDHDPRALLAVACHATGEPRRQAWSRLAPDLLRALPTDALAALVRGAAPDEGSVVIEVLRSRAAQDASAYLALLDAGVTDPTSIMLMPGIVDRRGLARLVPRIVPFLRALSGDPMLGPMVSATVMGTASAAVADAALAAALLRHLTDLVPDPLRDALVRVVLDAASRDVELAETLALLDGDLHEQGLAALAAMAGEDARAAVAWGRLARRPDDRATSARALLRWAPDDAEAAVTLAALAARHAVTGAAAVPAAVADGDRDEESDRGADSAARWLARAGTTQPERTCWVIATGDLTGAELANLLGGTRALDRIRAGLRFLAVAHPGAAFRYCELLAAEAAPPDGRTVETLMRHAADEPRIADAVARWRARPTTSDSATGTADGAGTA